MPTNGRILLSVAIGEQLVRIVENRVVILWITRFLIVKRIAILWITRKTYCGTLLLIRRNEVRRSRFFALMSVRRAE